MLAEDAIPTLKWSQPDLEGLTQFLVKEMNFNEDRVRKTVEKINASSGKSNQGALCESAQCCWVCHCGSSQRQFDCVRAMKKTINPQQAFSRVHLYGMA